MKNLPERWCVKVVEENLATIKSYKASIAREDASDFNYPYMIQNGAGINKPLIHEEITWEDFLSLSHDLTGGLYFRKGTYVVLTGRLTSADEYLPSNHCYRQRQDGKYLMVEQDITGGKNGHTLCLPTDRSCWRFATQREVEEYKRRGCPFNVNDLVLGYRSPCDIFKGRIKKGEIFSLYSENGFVMYNKNHMSSGVPTEIVENWEPVYRNTLPVIQDTLLKSVKVFDIHITFTNFAT